MITLHNFEADINNIDALGIMIKLKPTEAFEGGTALLMPHTFGPPIHFHPQQSEIFEVIQGELDVFKGKKWFTLKAGDKLFIPKKTAHSFRNTSNDVVVFDFAVTPKIGLTHLLLTLDELVKSGKVTSKKDLKSILYLTRAMAAFPAVTRMVKPPQWLVNIVDAVAAILGVTIEKEKFRAEFLRPVKLWKGYRSKPADISESILEEALF
jgi:mannose-6-phosphate isomerase-like protein (cupin superfamily)